MSTKTIPTNLPADITAQNEELLRIVEKQRIVIQNLQRSLALMTDERDNLLERNQDLEQERLVNGHGSNTRTSDGPVPPPRSPYRQNTSSPSNQQSQLDTGCATVWEPTLPSTYSYDRKPALEQNGSSSTQNSHHQEPSSPQQLQTSRSMTTNEQSRMDDGHITQQQHDPKDEQQRKYAEEQARRQREQEAYVEEQTRLHRQAMEEQMRRQRQQQDSSSYNDSQPRRQRQQDTQAEEQQQARWHRYQQDEQQHHAVTSSDIHVDEQTRLYHHQQQEAYYAYTTDEPQSPALPSTPRTSEGQHGPFTSGPMAGISVKVLGSNIFTNDKGQEVIAFTISVRGKTSDDPNAAPQEQWRIQKHYSDFLALDAQVQHNGTCTLPTLYSLSCISSSNHTIVQSNNILASFLTVPCLPPMLLTKWTNARFGI